MDENKKDELVVPSIENNDVENKEVENIVVENNETLDTTPKLESLADTDPTMYGVKPVAPPVVDLEGKKFVEPEVVTDEKEDNRIIKPLEEVVELLDDFAKREDEKEEKDTSTSSDTQNNTTNNSEQVLEENNNKAKVEYKEPGKFKIFLMILIFILLVVFIVYLPQIMSYFNKLEEEKNNNFEVKEIVTGDLSCSLAKSDDKFNYNNNYEFSFTNKRLNVLNTSDLIMSIRSESNAELNQNYNNCKALASEVEALEESGVVIACDLYSDTLSISQQLDFTKVKKEVLSPIYSKYGFAFTEYENLQNIDNIEKNMKANGYTCERFDRSTTTD